MHGIHHITAIAGAPRQNLAFYVETLGMRMVKKTVNFDDPGTYHLYYGDEAGNPGTIMTFFPWEHATAGKSGLGLTHTTMLRVPTAALSYWRQRLLEKGVAHASSEGRFGESSLTFSDADGLSLALVGAAGAENEPGWGGGSVPAEHAIRGVHGVVLWRAAGETSAVLTDVLGFREVAREGADVRYATGAGVGGVVQIRDAASRVDGRMGRGSVHHVAFRAKDDAEQAAMAKQLVSKHGLRPTGQKDRQYFRSIYFHEPGGELFEIATDQPGFAVDEPLADLGKGLKLPPFLEARRTELERILPVLEKGAA
jgi:glyoxalase family protein